MTKTFWLVAYYGISYSIGVASLVFAVILRFMRKEALLGRFIVCTSAMTAVVLSGTILSALGESGGGLVYPALNFLNVIMAAAYTYLIIDFAVAVFPFKGSRWVKALAFGLSAAGCVLSLARLWIPLDVWAQVSILAVKNLALFATAAIALRPGAGAMKGKYQAFLRIASISALVIGPFMAWEEIAGSFGAFPIESYGSLFLPVIYGIWSAAFIMIQLRRNKASGIAVGDIDPEFLKSHGVSPREGEVLKLLLEGRSYKEIMSVLCIAMPTVKSHIARLYKKTNTANRIELARKLAASLDSESSARG
jgi:DNA-binding CsgD family transcriptional regulator